jgi:hypothetical protein
MREDGVKFHSANSELISDGRDGFLASSDEQFESMLATLLKNAATVAEAGMLARRTIEAKHTWESHLRRYDSILETVVRWKYARVGKERLLRRPPESAASTGDSVVQ